MHRPSLTALTAVFACTVAPTAALAGGAVAVAPVTIEFPRGVSARSLEVSNPGDEAVDVQIRMFGWRVDAAGDHYEPSRDLGFSPPMFHLAPGARQVVRLAAPTPDATRERAYRLFIDQLPKADRAAQIQLPVRMVLPVFVAPAAPIPSGAGGLRWSATRAPGDKIVLSAENDGPLHVRLVNLAFEAGGASHVVQAGLAGYVLAGQSRRWTVPYDGREAALTVTAQGVDGPISAAVDLSGG